MNAPRCDRTEAWAALAGHYEAHGRELDLREAFARDAGRFAALSFEAPEVFADLSKNLVDTATLKFLLDLARECRLESRRDAMLAGEPINTTEGRAVLHTALRAPKGQGAHGAEVHGVLDAMLAYVETVRDTDSGITPRGQHRHRRQRPRPADGGAGARRLRAPRPAAALRQPTSTATTSRRCCAA
jgi:glucose-6-phosphate isomerase